MALHPGTKIEPGENRFEIINPIQPAGPGPVRHRQKLGRADLPVARTRRNASHLV